MTVDFKALFEKHLALPEFTITDYKESDTTIHYHVEKKDKPSVCPVCGVYEPRLRVHGSREQDVRDINFKNKYTGLILKRKRYKCMECNSTFIEPCDSIPEKARMTSRLRKYIAHEAKRRPFIDLERELDISNVTIREIFLEDIKSLKSGLEIETPTFIGIDEIHLDKNYKGRKIAWAVLCNGIDHTVIDMLPNRNKSTILEYLKNLKSPWNVEVVTMDMWQPYRDAVYTSLPNASIVIDRYHVVKMANEAVEKYRKSLKEQLKDRNINLKQEKHLFLYKEENLDWTNKVFRDAWFSEFPEFETVYRLKEDFFKIYDTAKDKDDAMKMYRAWRKSIPKGITVFKDLITSLDNWNTEIFNYFDIRVNDKRINNAYVEGANSAIRRIEALGIGYDFEVMRAKVMYCVAHKIEVPEYNSGVFQNMMYNSWQSPKDFGVPFNNLIRAINEGRL